MKDEPTKSMGKDTNELGGLRRYRADKAEEYTVLEYFANDGTLVHKEGCLLERFGITPPDNLHDLVGSMLSWPVAQEHLASAVSFAASLFNEDTSIGRPSDTELQLTAPGMECWVNVSAISLSYEGRRIIGLIFNSIDEKKRDLLNLIGQAQTDSLTGALNRSALESAVDQLAGSSEAHAFIMLDIDGFKRLNDTFGHIMGDNMLVDIVKKLRQGLRREDVIGRIGGDEFMICLRNVSERGIIERLAKHICVLTRHSLPNGMYLSASLGIAVSPRDGTNFRELYRNADIAMYTTKRNGGDGFTVFQPEMTRSELNSPDVDVIGQKESKGFDVSALIQFNILDSGYKYPRLVRELFDADFNHRQLWDIFAEDGVASEETASRIRTAIEDISISQNSEAKFAQYFLKTRDGIWRWYRMGFVRGAGEKVVYITLTDINEEIVSNRRLRHIAEYDELTGLLSHSAFNRAVEMTLLKHPEDAAGGEYAIVFFDILRFKAVNDLFGMAEGDRLLIYVADIIAAAAGNTGAASRIGSDRFAVFLRKKGDELEAFIRSYLEAIADYDLAFEIVSNAGIYVLNDENLSVDAMLDRAIIAQASIKGSYATKYSYYSEEQRDAMLSEQEIVGVMTTALAEKQFLVYFQPQYNHSTGKLVGAEALVRWKHPERGMIMPGTFIPIFEKNGFISKLDLFVFEQVCIFQRSCLDRGLKAVPISVNLTRYDLFQCDFIEQMENVRKKHGVTTDLIRIEITETAIVGSNQHAAGIIEKLHSYGYVVEMDDFGSGYSSLNVLKDINMDILKLDMKFVAENETDSRGGIVLSSIVRMAKWLNLPVIAEGVEHAHQADFLRSIGCDFMQGYLYSKPIPQKDYESLLRESNTADTATQIELIDRFDAHNFWDPESQETLIFNSYVGAAKIFSYQDGKIEVMRVNQKFLRELGGSIAEKDVLTTDPLDCFDAENRRRYIEMLERAKASGEEEECEYWRRVMPCQGERMCMHSSVRVIGRSGDISLFYESIRNITSEKEAVAEILHRESMFRVAQDQINIYYWEYDVKTRIMKPCYRCMRDLGLPPIVTNYPEPAIEMGIFPPEVADMYRQMHRQIENGAAELSADIPLTSERVLFRVRYTTEFDDEGNPVKAYGSAVLI